VLVGRENELQLLEGLVGRVSAGQGGAVWVAGDPGIGKSALIAAGMATAERQGCQVYSATVHEQSRVFPLHVLLDALGADERGAIPGMRESEPDLIAAGRAEIIGLLQGKNADLFKLPDPVTTVADRLVILVHRLCAVSPVIIMIDDAQWADKASLRVLLRLSGVLGQLPLLLVVAARPVPARPELAALREALVGAGGSAVDLGPVDAVEAAEMVRHLIGVPPGPALARQLTAAGGNPLYLRELIDALARTSRLHLDAEQAELHGGSSGLPGTLSAAIERRLRFLTEPVISALRMAAVLGTAFTVADLAIVTGRRTTELIGVMDEAVGAGVLIESTPGTLAFRHGLVHQSLYEGMPASLRAALHRKAAEKLAGAGAQTERVAMQLLAAPGAADTWMIDWIAEAAPMLCHRAPQVAAELLTRARDQLGWQDARRERLDADLAMAQLMLGDNEQVVRLARPVLACTRDPALAGRVAWTMAYALPRMDQQQQAIEVTDQALAREGLPSVWSARLRARRATSLFAARRYKEASAEAERAEAEGNQVGDRLAVGYALYTRARLEFLGRRSLTAAMDVIERALAVLTDEPEGTDLTLLLMVNLGGALSALGKRDAADRIYAQVAVLVERGTPPRQAQVRAFSAMYSFYRGRWDDALADLDAAAQLQLDVGYRPYLRGLAALVAVHRDDQAAADVCLRGADDIRLTDAEVPIEIEFLLVAWALAAERDANPAVALTRLLAVFDPDGTREFTRLGVVSTQWLPDVVRLALTVGEPAIAAAAAKVCACEADPPDSPTPEATALHCQGLLDGDPEAVCAAAALFQSFGYPLFNAQALENAAVLHAGKGNVQAARAAYLQAIGIYTDLGAAWDITRADARMRQHNIRRGSRSARRQAAVGWQALTPTEEKIARMVASGASNPDIAGQLFLSRYTVESHVSHILVKLAAKSRAEIARAVTSAG
jgi:DNA-binding CsgD family transcriptional regulator